MTDFLVDYVCAFKDNFIWILVDSNKQSAIVVDPGESRPVIHYLTANNLHLDAILITHHHYDHTNGAIELKKIYQCPVYGSQNSSFTHINHDVHEGDKITLNWLSTPIQVIAIPGHTLDHIAYILPNSIFCGDTLFSAGCGKIFEGTPELMYQSLQKIAALPDDTKIYCGHEYTVKNLQFAKQVEPENRCIDVVLEKAMLLRQKNRPTLPSLLADERTYNPFLRCHCPEVIAAVEQHTHITLTTPVEVLKYLREWKNSFA